MNPIIVLGTGPNSAKSHVCAGLARYLARNGVRVIPFKAVTLRQSLPAEATTTAEWWPIARAAGVPWQRCMTPVLAKPLTLATAELYVNDKRLPAAALISDDTVNFGSLPAADRMTVEHAIAEALTRLQHQADAGLLLVEGAGSPLDAPVDLANQFVFERLIHLVPRILITTDGWNGGPVGSLVGTHACLPDALRENVVAFVINRPRSGEVGERWASHIARRTGVSRIGIVPNLPTLTDMRNRDENAVVNAWADALEQAFRLSDLLRLD